MIKPDVRLDLTWAQFNAIAAALQHAQEVNLNYPSTVFDAEMFSRVACEINMLPTQSARFKN